MRRFILILFFALTFHYGDGQIIRTSPPYNIVQSEGYCDEYQDVYDSWASKPDDDIADAQNTFVQTLIDDGLWAKADIIDWFSTHTNTNSEALVNWVDPGHHNPSLNNSPTFTAYEGFLGITSGTHCIQLNYVPSTDATHASQNSMCIIVGVGSNLAEARYDAGGANGSNLAVAILSHRVTTDEFRTKLNGTDEDLRSGMTSSIGHFAASREGSTNYDTYVNSSAAKETETSNSSGMVDVELYACGYNNNGAITACGREIRYVMIFSGLTDQEVDNAISAAETLLDETSTGLVP